MEEKKGRIGAAIEWARNKCGRQISPRFARKYLVDDIHSLAADGGVRATMAHEKGATPLRTRDATRVRKIPAPASGVNESHPIQGIDRAETHRVKIGYTRERYLATVEDIEERPQPIERVEHVSRSLPETRDGYAERTVEASPARVAKEVISSERLMCDLPRKRSRIPWLRALMERLWRGK